MQQKQISDDESSDIGFTANTEAVTVQSLSENEIHAVVRHQDSVDRGNREISALPAIVFLNSQ